MQQDEQQAIANFKQKRAEKIRVIEDMMGAAVREGQTLDIDQGGIFDEHAAEIEAIDAHIRRLKQLAGLRTAT